MAGSALAIGRQTKMALLSHLGRAVPGSCRSGADVEIHGIAWDSRQVRPGDLFIAVPGFTHDGSAFIADALARGAVAVVSEHATLETTAARLQVADARAAMAAMARSFYGAPDERLTTVGITGTNGKTTTALLLAAACDAAGLSAGVIGTLGTGSDGSFQQSSRTTPEAPELYAALNDMSDQGRQAAILEVSSHALALKRVEGLQFDLAVFTNLTRDHLDFHKNMDQYFAAKALLFQGLPPQAAMAVNLDDPFGTRLLSPSRTRVVTYGRATRADVLPLDIQSSASGLRLKLRTPGGIVEIESPLLGRNNVANILAAMASACALDLNVEDAAAGIAGVSVIPGRAQRIDEGQDFLVLVDYAHTDDALMQILGSTREITSGRLIVVFGCGGDRDQSKRPLMGGAAARLADMAFMTSDNPRSEDPLAILAQVEAGFRQQESACQAVVEPDRAKAIAAALAAAESGDTVIIAGKGHENEQIFAQGRITFDDRLVARQALCRLLGKGA